MALSGSWRPMRGTTAQWKARPSYIPDEGQFIVYTDYRTKTDEDGNTVLVPGMKMGDGKAYAVDLPFMNESDVERILAELREHTSNEEIHVSKRDRTKWDGKLNSTISGEMLILTNDLD